MNEEQLNMMRERYKAEIRQAEGMIEFIDTYRFVLKDVTDTRSGQEVMDEQKQMHLRLIENYTTYLAALEQRNGPQGFVRIGNN